MPLWTAVTSWLLLCWLQLPMVSGLLGEADDTETAALRHLEFGAASTVRSGDEYATIAISIPSLNAGLWSSANITTAEVPFNTAESTHALPGFPGGAGVMESVLNLSSAARCTSTIKVLPVAPVGAGASGVAALPCAASAAAAQTSALGQAHGLTFEQCASHCCSQLNCSAFAWYNTTARTKGGAVGGLLCSTFTRDHITGPQPFGPAEAVKQAKGAVLSVPAPSADHVANGLRSGTWLGGVGTGGYEIRADGSFHLSTIRNQAPSAEPWQATVRDLVLAVSVDGHAHVVRLKPFGGLSGVPKLVYSDAFPAARLEFLGNLSLYAYSLITPGDSNRSNTPAVVFTLRTANLKPDGSPLRLSFMVAAAVFRNDWWQVTPQPQPGNGHKTREACAAACTASASCFAWQFVSGSQSCSFDNSSYAQGANLVGADSGFPGSFSYHANGVSFGTRSIVPAIDHRQGQGQGPSPPSKCQTAPAIKGQDVGIVGHGAHTCRTVAAGQPGLDACRAACCNQTEPACNAWVVADMTAPIGARPPPCVSGHACCWTLAGKIGVNTHGPAWATSSVASPGAPPTPPTPPPPPPAPKMHNGLGSEGLFVPGGQAAGCVAGFGSASSIEALLGAMTQPNPAAALNQMRATNASGHLFQAAAVTAPPVAAGQTASLSIVHAWHFPHYYWYRDSRAGSDIGVRYSLNFPDVQSVANSVDLRNTTENLRDWHSVLQGLPTPLLREASRSLFSHVRSAGWHETQKQQYRQWESFEFADYMNPTNGDERHVPYFAFLPETMRSKVLTEVDLMQEPDGMFPCVAVAGARDAQFGDPCAAQTRKHPDDITMLLIAIHEQFSLANDTALVAQVWPSVVKAFGFYKKYYDTSPWAVPYTTHETYDAVKEAPAITGEGNYGSSLYNAVNYLLGLHIVRELAAHRADASTAAEAQAMIHRVQHSIQRHFWQPAAGFYIGDTLTNNTYLLERNGWPYHSSDDLHGQVLAYRLGFGDLLPRRQMQLHQQYILRDLRTEWGLQFDDYSHQNWLMSDHSHASLLLRWNEVGAWETSARQIRYWREQKNEMTKNTAVIDTDTGSYGLLNYYGYALFFYHTIINFAGQSVSLPNRTLAFSPHSSAFDESGVAVVPILLGGELGTLTITSTNATLEMLFLRQPLSFARMTICQHTFPADDGAPHLLGRKEPYTLPLPSPCAMAASSSQGSVVSSPRCSLSTPVTGGQWEQWVSPPVTSRTRLTLEECQQVALDHHYCGYEYRPMLANGTCKLVVGTHCPINSSSGATPPTPPTPPAGGSIQLGQVHCNYSDVQTARVDTQHVALQHATEFADFSLVPSATAPSALNSSVYSLALPTATACQAQAAMQQACGFLFVTAYKGSAIGSCNAQAKGCCFLNPYIGCSAGTPGSFTGLGDATIGIFAALNASEQVEL